MIAAVVTAVSFWRLSYVKAVVSYIAKDEMPIWLSIVLVISAGVGTYYLAPVINENFEFQKNRSTHLINTIDELNKAVVSLSVATREFNDALFYNKKGIVQIRGAALDKIAELQWRLVDAEVVISRVSTNDDSTKSLSNALMILQNSIIEARHPQDQEKVADAHAAVVVKAKHCMMTLYRAANIN